MIGTAQWTEVWSRPDSNKPIRCGVESLLEDNKKLYRAYCRYPDYMGGKRTESKIYEACDEADLSMPTRNGQYIHAGLRDRAVAAAAVARSKMTPQQKSLQDMIQIATELMMDANREASKWERDEEERERLRIADLDALKQARSLVRGLQLLLEQGTEAEKATLKTLFSKARST